MDLFPDEAHVRLRNRVHDTYLHADEDGVGVSLRPHGRVSSCNAVWRVGRVPLQGTSYLLFRGTASGSYLAVSPDLAPPGYGGRRAVQRNYDADTHGVDPPEDILWSAVRTDDEGDDAYTFLRNFDRSLRTNGKHRIWHTGVTVASSDSDSTSMMHWAVEVIPPPAPSSRLSEQNTGFAYFPAGQEKTGTRSEILWVPQEKDSQSTSPSKILGQECSVGCDDSTVVGSDGGEITSTRAHTCLGCSTDSSNCLCDKCTSRMRVALLKAREASLGTGNFSFCLKCRLLSKRDHADGTHETYSIPLDAYDGSQVAWVTQKERWSCIFAGIQSDTHWNRWLGRPFLLHTPQGRRCEVCGDHLSHDKLYGTLIQFCSIECWANKAEAAAEFGWVYALIDADIDKRGEDYSFCNMCRCLISCEEDHQHGEKIEALSVLTGFMGGTAATKIEVRRNHFMASYWKCIKDLDGDEILSSPNHLFRLRDEGAPRCKGCKLRLEDGGGRACSLECSLRGAMMLPRPVQMQLNKLSEAPGAQELLHPDT